MRARGTLSVVIFAFVGTTVGTMLVAACGGPERAPGPPPKPAEAAAPCPDLSNADELGVFDFAKNYDLPRDAADRVKAATLSVMEIRRLSERLDAELGIACARIANDLGDRGDYRSGREACEAAAKAVREAKAKLGPKATVQLVVRPPLCLSDARQMTKCASMCDFSATPEQAKADCAARVGHCDGTCDGSCDGKGQRCEGTCSGTCEGTMKGTCSGRCKGQCDGRSVNGTCAGVCSGTCERGTVNGACSGACSGTCKLAKPGVCGELCIGTCSVELGDAKCAAPPKTPSVSPECRLRCELALVNETECAAPHVGATIDGARDRATEAALRGVIARSFPDLLRILFEVGEDGRKRAVSGAEGAAATQKAFAGTEAGAALTRCFGAAFDASPSVAAEIAASLTRAQAVRDAVTGS